jgi:hypothetical protein
MPRASFCVLGNGRVSAEEALEQRSRAPRRGRLPFVCEECGQPVKVHRAGGHGAAHFEHFERNPACRLSDPAR